MFYSLILLFTIIPAIELALLIKVGSNIGVFNTIFIIIFTGVLGAYLARMQGFIVFQKIQDNLNKGIIPNQQLVDGLMILIGGLLLLTPGFITDALGFLLLIPATRNIIKIIFKHHFEKTIKNGTYSQVNNTKFNNNYDDIDI